MWKQKYIGMRLKSFSGFWADVKLCLIGSEYSDYYYNCVSWSFRWYVECYNEYDALHIFELNLDVSTML